MSFAKREAFDIAVREFDPTQDEFKLRNERQRMFVFTLVQSYSNVWFTPIQEAIIK